MQEAIEQVAKELRGLQDEQPTILQELAIKIASISILYYEGKLLEAGLEISKAIAQFDAELENR